MKRVLNRFSQQSDSYKKFRPTYPAELYNLLFSTCNSFNAAWDCGTGNGQVALQLAPKFEKVFASDISEKQLANAERRPNIEYLNFRAEQSPFEEASIDLITVGQAIHWFDIPLFLEEARRVLKPEGVLAFWGYGLLRVSPDIDELIDHFYSEVVGPHWDFERQHVDSGYQTIKFDWQEIETPLDLNIQANWNLIQFEGFFNSWSAVQNYKENYNGINPVNSFIDRVRPLWNESLKTIEFPIFLRMGKR